MSLTSCQTPSRDEDRTAVVQPRLAVEVIQLRRDQALQRVTVAVRNTGTEHLLVESVQLDVAGFHIPGPVRKNSPVPAGQVVNLPVPYGDVTCPAEGEPRVGQPWVSLQVRATAVRTLRLRAQNKDGLLQRIATRACAVKQVKAEVALEFADEWRLERRPEGDLLHGTLRARLRKGQPRSVNQVAGAIMYGLRPDAVGTPPPTPLATLTPSQPMADIPVVAYAARCDGHTVGEIKKPYEFLAWVSIPGGEDIAIGPRVGDATKRALRRVCAF